MTDLITRARELAARERKLYDQRTIPAVLEELADEVERLTGERDEAQERARMNSFAGEGYVFMERRAIAAEAEADKLRAEAANSAAQRDEAEKRAEVAEERLRAVEADLGGVVSEAMLTIPDQIQIYRMMKAQGRALSSSNFARPMSDALEPARKAMACLAARAERAEAELARIRAADRTSITVRTTEAAKMRKGQAI